MQGHDSIKLAAWHPLADTIPASDCNLPPVAAWLTQIWRASNQAPQPGSYLNGLQVLLSQVHRLQALVLLHG